MRRSLFVSLILFAAVCSGIAPAQQKAPFFALPRLNECETVLHPHLPNNWHAVFLMAPFTNAQLVLSDIDDASLPAMRVKLYGLRHGSLDLFITDLDTYVLSSQGGAVSACEKLGDTGWRPLPQDLLSPRSQCVGSSPLGTIDVQWWKTPVEPGPSSYWIWYKTSDQTPFRLAFQSSNNQLGVLSHYALSYQIRFESNSDVQLASINRACKVAKQVSTDGAQTLDEHIANLSSARERADDEIHRLAPQLSNCPATALPVWPDKLAITGLMTPWDVSENPYATEVLYDWTVRAQRTRIFPHSSARFVAQDSLLLDRQGYTVTYRPGSAPICEPVLPGPLRPDWLSRGPCSCEAMLMGTTPLTPHGTARIFTCPLAPPRAAWAWYALDGRPTSFAVTSLPRDQGFGLFAALDYRDWLPGKDAPAGVFDKPPQCEAHGGVQASISECSSCHLGKTGAVP